MRRVLAVIDGSNFYHGVKRLCPNLHLTAYDYRTLVEKVSGRRKVRIICCVGEIRKEKGNKKSLTLYSQQQSLFYNLSKQKIDIYKGFMLKSAGKYHEKGVDVRIAVEILKGALRDEYDECLLFSSDTDIIPAILEAKKEKKAIVYVGFGDNLSKAMRANCGRTIVLNKKDIK